MSPADDLAQIPNLILRPAAPLSRYTTFRIGGPAEILVEATTEDSLLQAISFCRRWGVPLRFLGGGSNVLVSDGGLDGVTVVNKVRFLSWTDDGHATVSGGFSLDDFVEQTAQRSWQGIEFAAGIPGTVGGGLAGGAGAYGHLLGDYLFTARILDSHGTIREVSAEHLGIGYRESAARERGEIILSATFHRFQRSDRQAIQREIRKIKEDRACKHPGPDLPSGGSFFRNLPPLEPDGQRVPAGKLLDEAGVKGLRIGDAQVFEKHANIIVNRGWATAADVNRLAQEMAERVRRRHRVNLVREILYWA